MILFKFKHFFKLLIFFSFLINYANSNEKEYVNFLGSEGAKNTLIEYASLSCVHCANFHNDHLPEIKKELIDKGKLKFIYKDYPLDMQAMLGSMVAHCYKNEQYFTILSSLFKNQKNWVPRAQSKEEFNEAIYDTIKEHGITQEKIIQCTEDNEINKAKWDGILATRLNGQKLGVNSTPSFFLNGKKLDGKVDLKLIKSLIK